MLIYQRTITYTGISFSCLHLLSFFFFFFFFFISNDNTAKNFYVIWMFVARSVRERLDFSSLHLGQCFRTLLCGFQINTIALTTFFASRAISTSPISSLQFSWQTVYTFSYHKIGCNFFFKLRANVALTRRLKPIFGHVIRIITAIEFVRSTYSFELETGSSLTSDSKIWTTHGKTRKLSSAF